MIGSIFRYTTEDVTAFSPRREPRVVRTFLQKAWISNDEKFLALWNSLPGGCYCLGSWQDSRSFSSVNDRKRVLFVPDEEEDD